MEKEAGKETKMLPKGYRKKAEKYEINTATEESSFQRATSQVLSEQKEKPLLNQWYKGQIKMTKGLIPQNVTYK